jgi:hypothetical protein
MIAKGNRHNNGVRLAHYLTEGTHGERAELWELRGFASNDIFEAFSDVHVMAEATKAEKPLFHVQVRNREGETLTREQWRLAADRIERILGLTGQPRAIAFHIEEKTGDEHMHIAFSLIDAETMKARPLPFYKFRLKTISRELEKEFGLAPVRNERDSAIKYAATRAEEQQAQRLGMNKEAIRNTIRECWDRADCGQSFQAALEHEGLILTLGDRRNLVVVDHAGGLHALGKRILDVNKNAILERLADLDLSQLPHVEQAREFIREAQPDRQRQPDMLDRLKQELAEVNRLMAAADPEQVKRARQHVHDAEAQKQIHDINRETGRNLKRDLDQIDKLIATHAEREYSKRDPVREDIAWHDAVAEAAIEKEKNERRFVEPQAGKETRAGREQAKAPELGRTAGEIRLAYALTQTGPEFANALEDRGLILAQTTEADAERMNRWDAQRLREQGRQQQGYQKYRAGELVVVNQHGDVFKLTRSNTGDDFKARAEHLKDIDLAPLLNVTAAQGVMKRFQQDRREEKQELWEQKREAAEREKHWPINPPQPERKSPGLFEKAATEAGRDNRAENLTGPAAHVWTAWQQSDNAKAFAAALDDKGIAFAKVTREEADRSHSKEAAFARAVGNYTPRFKEGEIVIVTEARPEHRRDGEITEPRSRVHKLDQSLAAKFVKALGNADRLQGIDATKQASANRAQQRAADWQAIRLERATTIKRAPRTRAGNAKDNLLKRPAAIAKAPLMALNVIAKPAELLSNAIEGLFAPILTPEQIRDGKIAAQERKADAREQIDLSNIAAQHAQERQQEEQREAARQRERERERGGRER